METITFQCKVITPMFLAGADGRTPELRAPSIKGAMRFWWRAIHGHLPLKDVKNGKGEVVTKGLKTLEAEIFGGSGNDVRKSQVLIRVRQEREMRTQQAELVPHKPFMKQQAFCAGETFQVILSLASNINKENPPMTIQKLSALFQLTCILGGFGKRVRRGMGSVHIVSIDNGSNIPVPMTLPYLHGLISQFSGFYTLTSDNIYFNYSESSPKYGYIQQVELGRPDAGLLRKISKATHDVKRNSGFAYDPSMGHAFRGRYASPVYVSAVQGSIRPIITTLNNAPDKNEDRASLSIQKDFKDRIL